MRDRVARRLHALLDVPAPALDEPLPLQPDVRLDHRLLLSDPNVITNKYCNKSDNKITNPFGLGPLRVTLWVLVLPGTGESATKAQRHLCNRQLSRHLTL